MAPKIRSKGDWLAIAAAMLPARALFALVLAMALLAAPASAAYLVVNRPVTLRTQPSAASEGAQRVEPGQTLPLATESQTNGYYQVEFPPGETHWVYRSFVRKVDGTLPGTAPSPASTATAGSAAPGASPLGKLEVHVINVGQGDAILIRCPDGHHQMLIDSGDTRYPGSTVSFQNAMSELQSKDDPIEVVVASHPHADHIGNMEWLLRQAPCSSCRWRRGP